MAGANGGEGLPERGVHFPQCCPLRLQSKYIQEPVQTKAAMQLLYILTTPRMHTAIHVKGITLSAHWSMLSKFLIAVKLL